MAISLGDLKNIDLKQANRVAPVVLLLLILYLCWKLAAMFWLLIAPPQAMQLDRVELGSQQAQIPNISAFSLFQESGQTAAGAEAANILLQGVVVASPSYNSSAVLKVNDQVDRYRVGESLYDTLEHEIVPLYYTKRSADGLPGDWIQRIKECIRTTSPQFSMTRMVKEYADDLYLPALLSARGEDATEA